MIITKLQSIEKEKVDTNEQQALNDIEALLLTQEIVALYDIRKSFAEEGFRLITPMRIFFYRCYKEVHWYDRCFFASKYKKYAKKSKEMLKEIVTVKKELKNFQKKYNLF